MIRLYHAVLLLATRYVIGYLLGVSNRQFDEVLYKVKNTVVSQKPLGNNLFYRRLETKDIVQSEAVVRCDKPADKSASCAYAGPGEVGQVYLRNTWKHLQQSLAKMPKDLLLLGFGAMIPAFVLRNHPQVRITAVDIDPEAANLATRFLGIPRLQPAPAAAGDPPGSKRSCGGKLCVVITDAQDFIASQLAAPQTPVYDAAIVDMFGGDGSPPAFVSSTAFLSDLARVVKKNVLFTEDVETLSRNQMVAFNTVWSTVEISQFSSEDRVVLTREICPCEKPGDNCGCGDENRFILLKDIREQQRRDRKSVV